MGLLDPVEKGIGDPAPRPSEDVKPIQGNARPEGAKRRGVIRVHEIECDGSEILFFPRLLEKGAWLALDFQKGDGTGFLRGSGNPIPDVQETQGVA